MFNNKKGFLFAMMHPGMMFLIGLIIVSILPCEVRPSAPMRCMPYTGRSLCRLPMLV